MSKILSKQEPKGTKDWLPEEFAVRKYIFDCWRRVCERYGFEEYLTPIVESADIYRAKSGEDVGGKELVVFQDLGGRELSIRPEMTPSVVRMVSKIYATSPKPLKFFSIANFMRNEKPQRGRNREFWQLNCDIFGSASPSADIEILTLALDLVLEFDPPQDSFCLSLNSRRLLDGVLELAGAKKLASPDKLAVVRTLDKWQKLSPALIQERLQEAGLSAEEISVLKKFMSSSSLDELAAELPALKDNAGWMEIDGAMKALSELGYADLVIFDPTVIRGFDYYDGLVFEVFDKHPSNNRAMFGGGRYNGLAQIFGEDNFPAVGFAPGDEAAKLFLESWDLLGPERLPRQERFYLPLLSENLLAANRKLARKLRMKGGNVFMGLEEQKIAKALEFANKKGFDKVVLLGQDEADAGIYKIKDMASGEQTSKKLK